MNSTEPLGLPRGSVRALLTFAIVAALVATMFVSVVPGAVGVRDGLLALAAVSLRDYFTTRQAQNAEDGPAVPPAITG